MANHRRFFLSELSHSRARNKFSMPVVHLDNWQVMFGCLQEYLVVRAKATKKLRLSTNVRVNNATMISRNNCLSTNSCPFIAQNIVKNVNKSRDWASAL